MMLKDLAWLLSATNTEHIFKWVFDVSAHLFILLFLVFTAKRIVLTAIDCYKKVRELRGGKP
jgi:hypothetical protein